MQNIVGAVPKSPLFGRAEISSCEMPSPSHTPPRPADTQCRSWWVSARHRRNAAGCRKPSIPHLGPAHLCLDSTAPGRWRDLHRRAPVLPMWGSRSVDGRRPCPLPVQQAAVATQLSACPPCRASCLPMLPKRRARCQAGTGRAPRSPERIETDSFLQGGSRRRPETSSRQRVTAINRRCRRGRQHPENWRETAPR